MLLPPFTQLDEVMMSRCMSYEVVSNTMQNAYVSLRSCCCSVIVAESRMEEILDIVVVVWW